MTVETRYDIGDRVRIADTHPVRSFTVGQIRIQTMDGRVLIDYRGIWKSGRYGEYVPEDRLAATAKRV